MSRFGQGMLAVVVMALLPVCAMAAVRQAEVVRAAPDQLSISWQDANPVDIYQGDRPDFPLAGAEPVVRHSTAGAVAIDHAGTQRRYFVLVDARDHRRLEVAERLVPLAQGSNFRDIGGYVGAGGKHVRWGLIYRSAGQPLLSPADVEYVHALHVAQLVDLRSSEERVIAPTRITGVPYAAVGYSFADLTQGRPMHNGVDVYHAFPALLAPQLRIVFAHLLHEKTPIVYNCSAGQDRTGFTTAIVLTALGVPNATIEQDYHLSTLYRRPENEMPKLSPAMQETSPVAAYFGRTLGDPVVRKPQPLYTADGTSYLSFALDEVKKNWGSVEGYLAAEAGVTKADLVRLRAAYTE